MQHARSIRVRPSFAIRLTAAWGVLLLVSVMPPVNGALAAQHVTSTGNAPDASAITVTSDTPIQIPNGLPGTVTVGPADPYPATITVAGLPGLIQRLAVRLNGLSHTFPADLDVLLVGPQGQTVVLMSDVGSGGDIAGVDLTFDDGAPGLSTDQITTGTYAPTDRDVNTDPSDIYPAPAPPPPYGTSLSVFNGTDPNGTWRLFVLDDNSIDTGSLGSFSLLITLADTTGPQAPTSLYVQSVVGNLVTLRWTPSAAGPTATGFVLEGGLLPGQVLASLPTGSASPIFTFIAPTGSFFARVHQISGDARSGPSNEVALHVNVPVPPSAPAGLVAVVNGNAVDLAWRNTFAGAAPTSFILDVTGTLGGSIPLAAVEQASFPIVPGGTYTLSLRASNAGGTSDSSNAVTITVPAACTGAPLPPENFLFYKADGRAHVIWDPAASGPAATSYILNVSGPFSIALPTTARALSGVPPPGAYTATVIAVNACGASAPTAVQTLNLP